MKKRPDASGAVPPFPACAACLTAGRGLATGAPGKLRSAEFGIYVGQRFKLRLHVLTPEAMQALLPELARTAPTAHSLTLFPLLAVCRASEALRLKREHGDFTRETAHFPETKNARSFSPRNRRRSRPPCAGPRPASRPAPGTLLRKISVHPPHDCEREQYGGLDS